MHVACAGFSNEQKELLRNEEVLKASLEKMKSDTDEFKRIKMPVNNYIQILLFIIVIIN
jgi:hypothetical protein